MMKNIKLTSAAASASIFFMATVVVTAMVTARRRRRQQPHTTHHSPDEQQEGGAYESLIGQTPLVKLNKLSRLLNRSIYVKMECLNPGGTGKDRAALGMIQRAEAQGELPPPTSSASSSTTIVETNDNTVSANNSNTSSSTKTTHDSDDESIIQQAMQTSRTGGLVVEGTSGSTGISLAILCASRGHACLVVLPDDQASEKHAILTTLGAIVHVVPNCAISNPNHYVNVARRLAQTAKNSSNSSRRHAVFINQFENEANFEAHYTRTGPELWRQCHHDMDAFVMSSGTGGTIAGVGRYLKEASSTTATSSWSSSNKAPPQVVLVDPPGSALYHRIHHGVAYAPQQRERAMKRHRYDTLAEGIGLDRMTRNFALGVDCIDDAVRVTDQEAVDMAHWLLRNEGLWVGSSSAMNVVGAVRVAKQLKPQSKVVTVICDTGQRHVTRFWNREFIKEWGLVWPGDDVPTTRRVPECLSSDKTATRDR